MADERIALVEDKDRPHSCRLVLRGRLDIETAKPLHQAALAALARSSDIAVCCRGVEYLHTSAIQILLCLGRDLRQQGRQCAITGGAIDEVLRLGGLTPTGSGS